MDFSVMDDDCVCRGSVPRGDRCSTAVTPGGQVLTGVCRLGSAGGCAHHFLYVQHGRQEAGHRGESPDLSVGPGASALDPLHFHEPHAAPGV